jgi:uncharacterized protein YndB with AHSA1/START domain
MTDTNIKVRERYGATGLTDGIKLALAAVAPESQTLQEWQLNNEAEVFIDVSVERLWAALTEAADTEQYFMRSRVTVGEVGEAYHLERDDGWRVDGTVLTKEPPNRLRVTWRIKTPPDVVMPNCEVEYLIEPALIADEKPTTKLTIRSYIDGPIPSQFLNASRSGWAMITRNLKEYLG